MLTIVLDVNYDFTADRLVVTSIQQIPGCVVFTAAKYRIQNAVFVFSCLK